MGRGSRLPLADIEAAYRRRYPEFLRVAVGIAGDEQAGRDAVHDAFVRAVGHRGSFRGEGSPDGWLWRIVVNAAQRRRSREARRLVLSEQAVAEASSNGAGETARVRALLAALPDRQRAAVFLRYYADLDYRTIADTLGIAPGTVAATLNAAHNALRQQLEEVES